MIHFPCGRYRWRMAAAAAAAAAGAMLVAACGGPAGTSASGAISPASGPKPAGFSGTAGTPSALATAHPSMSGMPSSAAPAPAGPPVQADAVTILNFAFGPQVISVKAGTTVHWTNHDTEAHTVTSNTGAFGSVVLQPGAGYSFTFNKPGTYHYHCTIHPFMTGTVMVS